MTNDTDNTDGKKNPDASRYKSIELKIDSATGVAELVLKRFIDPNGSGAGKVNALTMDMVKEITDAFKKIQTKDSVKKVLLHASDAHEAFCTGLDLEEMCRVVKQAVTRQDLKKNYDHALAYARMLDAIDQCKKPIVTVISGSAVGAGTTLAVLSDYVFAAQDAKFAYPEGHFALKPEVSGPFVVPRLGVENAAYLFASGEFFGTDKARDLGIVTGTKNYADKASAMADARDFIAGNNVRKKGLTDIERKPIPTVHVADDLKKKIANMRIIANQWNTLYVGANDPKGREALVTQSAMNMARFREESQGVLVAIESHLEKIRNKSGQDKKILRA